MKFLRQLFGRDSHNAVLGAAVNGELCRVLTAQPIGSQTRLQVETGQNAVIFNGDKRSGIYPVGEHLLQAQDIRGVVDGGEANILFLQTAPPVKRAFQTAYRPENGQPLILSGHYTAAVDDVRLLVNHLLAGGNLPDNRMVDSWIHQYVRRILTDQRIPPRDFLEHTGKLAVFLHDALIPYLLDYGIRLQNFTLAVEDPTQTAGQAASQPSAPPKRSVPPQEFPARTAPAMTPSLALQAALAAGRPQPTPEPPAKHAPPAESPYAVNDSATDDNDGLASVFDKSAPPKIFYRLEKGEQVGPYNIDELNNLIEQGKIRPTDLLWHQGLKGWQRAAEFSGLHWG